MLLDSQFVERFHALHRQKLSGCLTAQGAAFGLTICLVDGEPVVIDIHNDLEQAFIEACGEYHKLDDASLAELRAAVAGGAKARAYLLERQLISEAEADQLSQVMIEDALTRGFRGPCSNIAFVEGKGPESLPVGVSALKMRIGVEALIRTCDQRVNDTIAVEREIPNWQVVFTLSEAAEATGQLSEYEKLVLNFIDGKSTVEQIAQLCRDSSLNLGRVLRSLLAKKIIRHASVNEVRPHSGGLTPRAPFPAAVAGGSVSPALVSNITPYHSAAKDGSRSVVFVGLVVLLGICVAAAVMVINYSGKQAEFQKNEGEVIQAIVSRNWVEARMVVERQRKQAGSDVSALRLVASLSQRVDAAIEAERIAIIEAIKNEEFSKARSRILAMPESSVLNQRLHEGEEDLRADTEALTQEVRARLTTGNITGAMAALDSSLPRRSDGAKAVLSKWRAETFDIAQSVAQPLHVRLSALARLRQSRPEAVLEAKLTPLEADLRKKLTQISTQLVQLEQRAKAGAYAEVQHELGSMRLSGIGAGAEIEAQAVAAATAAKQVADEFSAALDAGIDGIARGASNDVLDAARGGLDELLVKYPQASGREQVDRIIQALAVCAAASTRSAAERADEITTLAAQIPESNSPLAVALKARADLYRLVEVDAQSALDHARRLGRAGDWKSAVQALELIINRTEWRSTAVWKDASVDLEDAQQKALRHAQLREELQNALRRGDVTACDTIAREIGLAYLPLVVISYPAGAELVNGSGLVIGTTPAVLDITADERVDLELQVRRPGYTATAIRGSKAEAGWKLTVRLERSPITTLEIGHPLTALPSVVNGTLWLADRGHVVSLAAPNAKPESRSIVSIATLNEPVFAPIALVGGMPLLATREKVGVSIEASGFKRMALPVATDWMPLTYRSPVVIDRELVIVPGNDGRIWAADRVDGRQLWRSTVGAAFASQAMLHGEIILSSRVDGRLESIRVEDGHIEHTHNLAGPVLASWQDGGGISGLTSGSTWSYDGHKCTLVALPEPCMAGGPGVAITMTGRVLHQTAGSWSEVGRVDQQKSRPFRGALSWAGQAVVVRGPNLSVYGPASFRVDAESDLLPPIIWNDHLVIVSIEGKVWIFQP